MKLWRRAICLLLACLMLAGLGISVSADESRVGKRYNVVFVTDESGSMKYTDGKVLRYDAINLFVALMAQHGNYLGSVTFDDTLIDSNPLQLIDGIEDKDAFMEHIRSFPPQGDTDIGGALMEALDLLDTAENQENPSVIILLSDGNTDLKPEEAMEKSLDLKAEAIDRARKAGYQIYTICLNSNGAADPDELRQIAEATGGQFTEVRNAEDLDQIETMYYAMIFGAIAGDKEELVIGSEGYVEKIIPVPGIGVEELNIMLQGQAERYELTNAQPYSYTDAELRAMSMSFRDYIVIKAEEPVGGDWVLRVYGAPGTKIDFQLLYNSDLSVSTAMTPGSDLRLGQTVQFRAVVHDRSGAVTDPAKYAGFSAVLTLTKNGEVSEHEMELGEGGFHYDLLLDQEGSYSVSMTVTDGRTPVEDGQVYELHVNNHPPVFTGEPLTDRAYIWPWWGGSAVVELKNSAQDPDGDPLSYSVESSAFLPEDYTLEGTRLEVHHFSISKGSFVIRATDPYGASCTVPVEITSLNIGLVAAIIIIVAGVIAAALVGIAVYRARFIPFMGTITVQSFTPEHESHVASYTPSRGKIRLTIFGLGTCGFHPNARFQAGGKNKKIYFICKEPFHTPLASKPVKKIPIDGNGLEVEIYTDDTRDKGIRVRFSSILNTGYAFDDLGSF